MNTIYLSATTLLLPAVAVLLWRTICRCYPWHLCTAADWFVLPVAALYILIILTAGWLARCAELWAPCPTREAASRRPSPGIPLPRVTTALT